MRRYSIDLDEGRHLGFRREQVELHHGLGIKDAVRSMDQAVEEVQLQKAVTVERHALGLCVAEEVADSHLVAFDGIFGQGVDSGLKAGDDSMHSAISLFWSCSWAL